MRVSLKCSLAIILSLLTVAHAAAAKKTYLYLANNESDSITIVNTSNNKIVKTLSLDGLSPLYIAMDPKGAYAYVSATNDSGSYYLYTIDTSTKEIVAKQSCPVGFAFVIAPNGKTAYTTGESDEGAFAFNIKTGKQSIIEPPQVGTSGLALSPGGKLLYVVNVNPPEVVTFSTTSYQPTATIPLENLGSSVPLWIAISPDGSTAYVPFFYPRDPLGQPSGVLVIDLATNAVVNSIDDPNGPASVTVSPDGQWVYVAESGSEEVTVINTSTQSITNTINTGTAGNTLIAFTPDGDFAYVSNASATVPEIDTATQTFYGQANDNGFYPLAIAVTGTVVP